MSQLPGGTTATADDIKITKYLLDPAHPIGRDKAQFFGSFGFLELNWIDLKKALLDHPKTNPVTSHMTTRYGEKYAVSCLLVTPDGRNPCIVSVWIIEPPDPIPQFVTAYPRP
jgi:hypothetical protein